MKKTKNIEVEFKPIQDAMASPIGRENWAVCTRMLVHDLIDIATENKQIKTLLDFYNIRFLINGGFTMALPRYKVCGKNKEVKEKKLK